MTEGPRIAVAMSGGVDSSVAAALLAREGADVFGVTMTFATGEHAGSATVTAARTVCQYLGIGHVVIDLADEFSRLVADVFRNEYAAGRTPNPCVRCNELVKFGLLLERTRDLGAGMLATGHYARLVPSADGVRLARATDAAKDQSYFLYRVPEAALCSLLFPLGAYTKAEVRRMAADQALPSAERDDSQEVCFAPDHVAFVGAAHPGALEPGVIEDVDGCVLGRHRGIARYTVGQRKGLGIGGPGGPYRVAAIDAARNTVVVASAVLPGPRSVALVEPVWRLGEGPARVTAQVRYRSRGVPATATYDGHGLLVAFDEEVGFLAPGQSVVCYEGDLVAGGGIVGP